MQDKGEQPLSKGDEVKTKTLYMSITVTLTLYYALCSSTMLVSRGQHVAWSNAARMGSDRYLR